MLTLNEIRNVNFRKSNFGGYRAEDVEAFIDEVQLSYDSLLKENAELLKRLESLTTKLEEYQREEDSIRNALMNAQKVGDASLRDAKHKAEIILKDATIKAEKIVSNAQIEIHRERDVIEKMQRDIADFKARLLKAYKEHLTLINSIPNDDIMRPDTKDAVSSVPMLDRDASAYNASRRDYPQDEYGYDDRRADDRFDRRNDFAPQEDDMRQRRDPRDQRDDMSLLRTDNTDENAFGGDRQEPVMPRERMNQSRGGFTVNIDDSMPPMQTTTLPPPMREQKKFSAFDSNSGEMSRDRSFGDDRPDMGGFDRSPITGNDMDGFGGKYADPDSLMNGGDDFRGQSFDQGRGGMPDDDRSFRRRFN
ncbi:MAG: DivIVA domain-containing protein [Clostridia bacterium]|nr:DivIVA domain-containing protein [Clostridia bacterium]